MWRDHLPRATKTLTISYPSTPTLLIDPEVAIARPVGPVPANFRVGLAVDFVGEDAERERLIDSLIEPRE